jgi:hypothetical protein
MISVRYLIFIQSKSWKRVKDIFIFTESKKIHKTKLE